MKKITLFQSFGSLKKVGDSKPYTKKKTGEESVLQNYSVNGHLFSLFGESQINFHNSLVGKPVILFGRIETKGVTQKLCPITTVSLFSFNSTK